METVMIVLILLMAVLVSHIVALFICDFLRITIPTPLVQIAVGAALAAFANINIALQPGLFMLLFLPPLLFSDGWNIPKEGLIRDKWTILEMALFLVLFAVVIVGIFMHWLIPAMPLAVAFALAAIMSPTDPVAVSAITERISVPKRLMHILEGESLLNDASGLVSMRFAVAAAMTGSFSLLAAFGTFLWTALAGLIIGAATTFIIGRLSSLLFARFNLEAGVQIIISLLIPFIAYLLAEHVEASGILASVAAGIMMSFMEDYAQNAATTRMRRLAVWETLQFAAGGIIFILLGEQLPAIIRGAAHVVQETGHQNPFWLLAYIGVIYGMLILLRFIWVWVSLRFTLYSASRRGTLQVFNPGWKLVAATSFAGVRGTITLAGVLTLPLFLENGQPFPARDLAILIAAGVIVLSLLTASLVLPFLLKDLTLPQEPSFRRKEEKAQAAAYEAAIQAVEAETHDLCQGQSDADIYTNAGAHIMQIYRDRLTNLSAIDSEEENLRHEQDTKVEKLLRLKALEAERKTYHTYKKNRLIPEESADRLLHGVDLMEAQIAAMP